MDNIFFESTSITKIWNEGLALIPETKLVSTDSRTIKKGQYFVAIEGENFDGFDYIDKALSAGAALIVFNCSSDRIVEVEQLSKHNNVIFIGVTDTTKYLCDLAKLHISNWKKETGGITLAICGSNGKTTHKEMLGFILNYDGSNEALVNKGSFNNSIGVPLTSFNLNTKHKIGVFEIGTNHPGEVAELCEVVDPDGGIITNIGFEHMEFFKTLENVFQEERSLYDFLLENKKTEPLILNFDDNWLKGLTDYSHTVSYGEENGLVELTLNGKNAEFVINGEAKKVSNSNIVGSFNLKNLVAVYLLARKYKEDDEALLEACSHFIPKDNRSQLIEKDDQIIYLDAYNANPSSMEVALNSFIEVLENKDIELDRALFILGDMKELGEGSSKWHQSIGQHLQMIGATNVAFIGEFREDFEIGYKGRALRFESAEQLKAEQWIKLRSKVDAIFIKGSRSLQLESILDITES